MSNKIVLQEEEYVGRLKDIIETQFFPQIQKYKLDSLYLDALAANDVDALLSLSHHISLLEKEHEKVVGLPEADHLNHAPDSSFSTKSTLQEFLLKYTSEDNAAFHVLLDAEAAKRKAWMLKFFQERNIQNSPMLKYTLVDPCRSLMGLPEHKSLALDGQVTTTMKLLTGPICEDVKTASTIEIRPGSTRCAVIKSSESLSSPSVASELEAKADPRKRSFIEDSPISSVPIDTLPKRGFYIKPLSDREAVGRALHASSVAKRTASSCDTPLTAFASSIRRKNASSTATSGLASASRSSIMPSYLDTPTSSFSLGRIAAKSKSTWKVD